MLRSTHSRSSSSVFAPYGKRRVVAEVEVVLLGQRDEALVQHGEPADAGVEDGDRQRSVGRHEAFMPSNDGGGKLGA